MTLDLSPLYHAIAAVALQCAVGLVSSDWFTGGALGCLWFLAREHTQEEYLLISKLASGNTAEGYYQAFLAALEEE